MLLDILNQVLTLLASAGISIRVTEYYGDQPQPYLIIQLTNVHLVDGEPRLEAKHE